MRYQKADVRGVGASFVFIPMAQSPRQKIAPNVSRIKATIPMINNEIKQLQSRRKKSTRPKRRDGPHRHPCSSFFISSFFPIDLFGIS
jgi:hypothetical protein